MNKKLLPIILCFVAASTQSQIQFTSVNPAIQQLTILNYGPDEVDIANYRLCSLFDYTFSGLEAETTIISGDFSLAQGESVTIEWLSSGGFVSEDIGADLNLYLPSGQFNNPANMVCFMQYGSSGNGREPEAVAAGLWEAGTFVSGLSPYTYTGNGTESGVAFWQSFVPPTSGIVINEVDCDTPGSDTMEFIELYGTPNESLEGMVLVFMNGSSDTAYEAFDLDGYTCNAEGFFVIGNTGVASASVTFANNSLQNGTDAVALYWGNAGDFPDGTAVTADNIIDAVVYETDDADDAGLTAVLTPGQLQVNEEAGGDGTLLSISRIPDGGTQLVTTSYVTQTPTPGASNILPCDGGAVETTDGLTSSSVCVDINNTTLTFQNNSGFPYDAYWYVLTDDSGIILYYSETSTVDFNALPENEYHVYGLASTGNIDLATLEAGDNIAAVSGNGCVSLSANFVTVTAVLCSEIICNGGVVIGNDDDDIFTTCLDDVADVISFSYMTPGNAPAYDFALCNQSGVIVQFPAGESFDFNTLTAGTYLVYGISYSGIIDPLTVEPGDFITEIETSGQCIDASETPITVIVQDCTPPGECGLLFISEYVEGSSDNKAIEVFNPTNFDLNLEEYQIALYHNGNTSPTTVFTIPGTLGPQEAFVITNQQASQQLLGLGDATSFVTEFNGDDVIELRHNGTPIDVFGIVGIDPGNTWTVNGGNSTDHTLVRVAGVTSPTTDWAIGSFQWEVFGMNDYSHLGAHVFDACVTTVPQISFFAGSQGGIEGQDVTVTVSVFNPVAEVTVDVVITGGSAIEDVDYTSTLPVSLTFPQGSTDPQSVTISIVDDAEVEPAFEIISLELTGNEDEMDFVIQTHNIVIAPSDLVYPVYGIGDVTTNNSEGEADSLGVICELRGVVHGINFNEIGLDFTLIDGNDGINVFSAVNDFGYTVAEGDSLHVQGQVMQFEGLTTLIVADVEFVSANNSLQQSTTVTQLTEANESSMVRIECVNIVDPAQWTNEGMDFVVTVSDGVNNFELLIESECPLYGMDPLEGHFSITGIGHQRDAVLPFNSGYMLRPRYVSDVQDQLIASFVAPLTLDQDNAFGITNTSFGATSFFWNFGDGTTSTDDDPTHQYTDEFIEDMDGSTITISLIAENADGCVDSVSVEVDVIFIGVNEAEVSSLNLFPNPATGAFTVSSHKPIESLRMLNSTGQIVSRVSNVNASSYVIDVSQLASGIYTVVVLEQGNAKQCVRVVVE